MIIFTETWLHPGISDAELGLRNYIIYRRDRAADDRRGGGIIIAISRHLRSAICVFEENFVEQVFVTVARGSSKYIIGGVYIPPTANIDIYRDHIGTVTRIAEALPDHVIILAGDFNLPGVRWVREGDEVHCDPSNAERYTREKAEVLGDGCEFLGLNQICDFLNRRGNTLDLILCQQQCDISKSDDPLVEEDTEFHTTIVIELTCDSETSLIFQEVVYDFRRADTDGLNGFLSSVQWDDLLLNLPLSEAVAVFYAKMYEGMEIFIPKKRTISSSEPPWLSAGLKQCIREKKIAHKAYKRSNTPEHYREFSVLRARCKWLALESYSQYVGRVEEGIATNVKSFWGFVNARRSEGGLPSTMRLNEKEVSNGDQTVNLFADFFESVYIDHGNEIGYIPPPPVTVDLFEVQLTYDEVLLRLKNLDTSKGPGPDGIPASVLKPCAESLASPLFQLFSISLRTGNFPDAWRMSFIAAIHKSGCRHDVKNYRPVSITSTIPKMLDSIVTDFMAPLLRDLIVEEQHGFVTGRSTVSNLVSYEHYCLRHLEEKRQVDAVYTDFAKAFDSVSHARLIGKLQALGIQGTLLLWIKGFLTGRTQRVRYKNCLSRDVKVTSGVPQGSHLGPLLFLLFVNDISLCFIYSRFLMFADDVKIYMSVGEKEDCSRIQSDLDRMWEWCEINRLALNLSKCKTISLSRKRAWMSYDYILGGQQLERVEVIRDLGVLVDQKMSFVEHIASVTQRALRSLGFVSRFSREFRSANTFRILYMSLVRPILCYASEVWNPGFAVHSRKLERVQHKFMRMVAFRVGRPMRMDEHDYSDVAFLLNIPSLETLRRLTDLTFLFKLITGGIDCQYLSRSIHYRDPAARVQRRVVTFELSVVRSHFAARSPIFRITNSANNLGFALNVDLTLPVFKSVMAAHVLRFD